MMESSVVATEMMASSAFAGIPLGDQLPGTFQLPDLVMPLTAIQFLLAASAGRARPRRGKIAMGQGARCVQCGGSRWSGAESCALVCSENLARLAGICWLPMRL